MFFDIGANIGMWSLANSNVCDKIIAVEASPYTYNLLVNKCQQNNKIVYENYAVCNHTEGSITFYEEQNGNTLSTINKQWLTSSESRFYNTAYREITVRTITIDALIEKYGIPSLIKIDVEGGEYECISSLTQKIDMLCFEWASEVNPISFNCLDYLVGLGFSQFYLQFSDEYTFRPTEFYDIHTIKEKLNRTIPKIDWGMIWCK